MTEHEQLVKDCEEREERLTDWERNFIDSLSYRLAQDKGLTPPQIEILESIWERVT